MSKTCTFGTNKDDDFWKNLKPVFLLVLFFLLDVAMFLDFLHVTEASCQPVE